MEMVRVDLGERSYEVMVGAGLMERIGELTSHLSLGSSCALITHEKIFSMFGDRIMASLKRNRQRVYPIFIPEGEVSKNLEWASRIYQVMIESGLDRSSFVVALGGGVVGDLAGFVAATYMRGLDLVHVPTTLLSQVDASLGGKTAVNLSIGKNLVGVFHQPRLVLSDVDALESLSKEEFRSGMGEVIKYGVIKDPELFDFIESEHKRISARNKEALEWIIHRSCRVKAWVVSEDERESNLRAILNYGHTVGHALEAGTQYQGYKHGQAIAVGMACAGWIAKERGFWNESDLKRQNNVIKLYNLPITYKRPSPEEVYHYLWADKKKKQGTLTFILPRKIGEVFLCRDVSEKMIKEALNKCYK